MKTTASFGVGFLVALPVALFLSGCSPRDCEHDCKPVSKDGVLPAALLPQDAARALTEVLEGANPEAVFVFDSNGGITLFQSDDKDSLPVKEATTSDVRLYGLIAEKINPWCFRDTYGRRRCVP